MKFLIFLSFLIFGLYQAAGQTEGGTVKIAMIPEEECAKGNIDNLIQRVQSISSILDAAPVIDDLINSTAVMQLKDAIKDSAPELQSSYNDLDKAVSEYEATSETLRINAAEMIMYYVGGSNGYDYMAGVLSQKKNYYEKNHLTVSNEQLEKFCSLINSGIKATENLLTFISERIKDFKLKVAPQASSILNRLTEFAAKNNKNDVQSEGSPKGKDSIEKLVEFIRDKNQIITDTANDYEDEYENAADFAVAECYGTLVNITDQIKEI